MWSRNSKASQPPRRTTQRVRETVVCGLSRIGLFCCFVLSTGSLTQAQALFEKTHLIDVRDGADLSRKVQQVSYDRITLSDGEPVSFQQWYTSNWTDIRLTWMTEVNRNFGIYWGFSTGESGQKYRIAPGFKLGFLLRADLSQHSILSLSATTILGGFLTEDTCTADYGAIGGVQTVNCRLAASPMPPSETLRYLFNVAPADRVQINLRYEFRF